MSGMEMLFKSLGLDPEVMTKTAAEFRQGIEAMNANMAKIIAQNQEVLLMLHGANMALAEMRHDIDMSRSESDSIIERPFANDGPVRSVVNHGE